MSNTQNYALRLPSSLYKELKLLVEEEGTTINQFINIAVAEKLSALRTESFFKEKAKRADLDQFAAILSKAGSEEVLPGDEIIE